MSHPALPRPEAADLDTRIRLAEQALVARERRVLDRAGDLARRTRRALTPARLALSAAGALLVGGVLWRVFHRPGRAAGDDADRARPAREARARAAAAPVPWVGLLGLVWPLLPQRVRARTSPATVAAVMGVAVPLIQKLAARRQRPPLRTVDHVDLARYAGDWYEIARLPAPFEAACDGQPSAHYALDGGRVAVENRCPAADGSCRSVHGVARVVPGSGNARLEVNVLPAWLHALPFGWTDYQILALDADYQVALVGHPQHKYLWLLSRTPEVDQQTRDKLLEIAREQGYVTSDLIWRQAD